MTLPSYAAAHPNLVELDFVDEDPYVWSLGVDEDDGEGEWVWESSLDALERLHHLSSLTFGEDLRLSSARLNGKNVTCSQLLALRVILCSATGRGVK